MQLPNAARLKSQMPSSLEKFIQQLKDSSLVTDETLKNFIPPAASPEDAVELAVELIQQKKLTKFQAEEISRGNGASLTLGNYVLLDMIGQGGMGQVYKAQHTRMDRLVAIKVLPPSMIDNSEAIARFEREVKAIAKISHPNIVTAYDSDFANGIHFLVMEYVEGSDLSALIKKNGPLPVEKAVSYVLQAAKGLEAAGKKGIIHRDIKPANLLLDLEGNVKILDMGLARLTDKEIAEPQLDLTKTGSIMGTVDYMAPEQALDTKTADTRADIYSLGCTFYFLLTGKALYHGDTVMKRLLAHREQRIPSLRESNPLVPVNVDTIFQQMVSKKKEDRQQSMTAVIADLEQLVRVERVGYNSQTSSAEVASFNEASDTESIVDISPFSETIIETKQPASPTTIERKSLLVPGVVTAVLIGALLLAAFAQWKMASNGDTERRNSPSKGTPSTAPTVSPAKNKPLAFSLPGFSDWVRSVEALPPDEQIVEVSKKMMELNPGFDGRLAGFGGRAKPITVKGKAIELEFSTDKVDDLSPLRALTGLKHLACGGSLDRSGILQDLSPLDGMSLIELHCTRNPRIQDLSAISHLPLLRLNLSFTSVSDLSPLRQMDLVYLSVNTTNVSDLSPLRNMPLETLDIWQTNVKDLSPIAGVPLRNLSCGMCPIATISPLSTMQLFKLYCGNTQISDLSPLEGMPLIGLSCDGTPVSDLTALQGMPLQSLEIRDTRVEDLAPLQGMNLQLFHCDRTQVADLSPLRGMPLARLGCEFTNVSDLSILRGALLNELYISDAQVTDLTPLEGMPLRKLFFTPSSITHGLDIVRQMKSLEVIGLIWSEPLAASEFWKKLDAGELRKPIRLLQ